MSDLVRYDPLEHGRLAGGLKEYRGFTQKDARAACRRYGVDARV